MSLALSDQLCFPLYAAARAMQQRYRPLLEELGLTYPQYLVMLVLWEADDLSVSDIGDRLFLDSGTLTPLLKRVEAAGLIRRARTRPDGRVVTIQLTAAGLALRDRAESVPARLAASLASGGAAERMDLAQLKRTLDTLLQTLQDTP